ncbi:MAG: 1-acyl-sn-glycerol-3-phosphate acyltransferase [Chthonomonadales bacterium]|nr:1-acyl-sn-glycerol-3-phosphate acyltransferase [Chthonomonadales bacterium]
MTLFYRVIRDAARLLFVAVGRTRVIGHENIPESGGVIVACNHVSYLDPPLVGSNIRRECAFMARHDLWRNRLFGAIISRLNAFPVHRDTADRAAIRAALEVLNKGLVLVLFPEGTRSSDGLLQHPEPGLALIVQRSSAPIVPTAVVGPEVMWPPGAKRLRRVPLSVVFGTPRRFEPGTPRDRILDCIMEDIAELLLQHRPGIPPTREGRPSDK